jgi:hypothetical protein
MHLKQFQKRKAALLNLFREGMWTICEESNGMVCFKTTQNTCSEHSDSRNKDVACSVF